MKSEIMTAHLLPKLAAPGELDMQTGALTVPANEEKNGRTPAISMTAALPMAAVWGD